MGRRKTLVEFIKESKEIHNNKYDYSLVEYKNNKTKVKIICKKHGIFEQTPNNHICGSGCPKCNNELKKSRQLYSKEVFMKKSNIVHQNKYDYSLVIYKGNKIKVEIICPIHGLFEQKPNDHLNGSGCKNCSNIKLNVKFKKTKEVFIKESKEVHGNKYDYSLVEYNNNRTKVKIICPIHGLFEQTPHHHINGFGCRSCRESNGERIISKILDNKNINYIREKTFDKCKYKQKLHFDFYLPQQNICIEFDGKQHYKTNEFFGGEKGLIELQKKDKIKNEYCKNNKIQLIRIRYDEKIESYLEKIT